MKLTAKLIVIIQAVAWTCHDARSENVVFDIWRSSISEPVSSRPLNAITTAVTRVDSSTTRFRIGGRKDDRVQWYVPVNARFTGQFEIRFEVAADNISGTPENPILSVLAAPGKQSNSALLDINWPQNAPEFSVIPLFFTSAQRDRAAGVASFANLDSENRLAGIKVDMTLKTTGEGVFDLKILTISLKGNLLGKNEVSQPLATSPAQERVFTSLASETPVLIASGAKYPFFSVDDRLSTDPYRDFPQHSGEPIGIRRLAVNLGGVADDYPQSDPIWVFPDYIDFAYVEHRLRKIAADPKQRVIIDLLLKSAPPWWVHANGQSVASKRFSDVDPKWAELVNLGVRQLLAFIESSPHRENVIGVAIAVGEGIANQPFAHRDQQPSYTAAFRDWLRQRYQNVEHLQREWNDDAVSFDNATSLPIRDWPKGTIGSLIHPASERHRRDSRDFYYHSWFAALERVAAIVKESTGRRYLTGIVNGPVLFMHSLWSDAHTFTGNFRHIILASDDVDFFEISADHTDTRLGNGISGLETLLADELSIRNKSLVVRAETPVNKWDGHEFVEYHRRLFVSTLLRRAGLNLVLPPDDSAKRRHLLSEMRSYQRLFNKVTSLSRQAIAELAFVVDPDVADHVASHSANERIAGSGSASGGRQPAADLFYLFTLPRTTWDRTGVPYHVRFLDEFNPADYSVIVFFNTCYAENSRRSIAETCKQAGRSLIFTWASGFVSDRYLSPQGTQELSGIGVTTRPGPTRFIMTPEESLDRLMPEGPGSSFVGWMYAFREPDRCLRVRFRPAFVIDDEDAQILATYRDGYGASIAMKQYPDWTSYYSASPLLNAPLLRSITGANNIHGYLASNDLSFSTSYFIGFHTVSAGVREIKLSAEEPLFEVFRGQELKSSQVHRVEIIARKTYLFFRGDRHSWEQLGN